MNENFFSIAEIQPGLPLVNTWKCLWWGKWNSVTVWIYLCQY